MSKDLNERSRKILESIIEDYIESGEPVGSRAMTRRHQIGLSPATVRNVMSDLEEMGYLASPHTSAGRVPTELGYQMYVDSILQVMPLSAAQQKSIFRKYDLSGRPLEDVLQEAGKILSAISNYTGIVMVPRIETTVFRHIEFLKLSQHRILVILVSQSGLVQNKVIEVEDNISQSVLEQMGNCLNPILTGVPIQKVKDRIVEEMSKEKALYDKLLDKALHLSKQAFTDESGGRIFIEGASNIIEQPEFADVQRMKRLFQTFEQKSTLVELLDKSQKAGGVQIFIGSESRYSEIEGCSLVTSTYSSQNGTIGTLGVIGPSRMKYSTVIPIVDYTARLVSQVLESKSE